MIVREENSRWLVKHPMLGAVVATCVGVIPTILLLSFGGDQWMRVVGAVMSVVASILSFWVAAKSVSKRWQWSMALLALAFLIQGVGQLVTQSGTPSKSFSITSMAVLALAIIFWFTLGRVDHGVPGSDGT
jgi:hypothetical protein